MPDLSISGLPADASPALSSMLAVRVGSTTYRTTLTELAAVIAGAIVTSGNVDAADAIMDADFAGSEVGSMIRTGAGNYEVIKHNLTATEAPGVSNDSSQNYAVGSRWIDITNDNAYLCVDASSGAAVWLHLNLTEPTAFGIYNGAPGGENPPDASNRHALGFSGLVTLTDGVFGSLNWSNIEVISDPSKAEEPGQTTVAGTSWTLDAGAADTILTFTSGSAIAITVNAGTSGKSCLINVEGAGLLTFTDGTGTIRSLVGSSPIQSAGQYGQITVHWRSATEVYINGAVEDV